MNLEKMQAIHALFQAKNYKQLYQEEGEVLRLMLMVNSFEEFQDFCAEADTLEEPIFWLYEGAVSGENLLIGGYDEDVSQKVQSFLKEKLPSDLFGAIEPELEGVYVDIDDEDNLQAKIELCNQRLKGSVFSIHVDYEDTYCAGAYFLWVERS